MHKQILSQFDMPWLPITALIIFFVCFIIFMYWTYKKENKSFYEYTSQIPFQDGVKHEQ